MQLYEWETRKMMTKIKKATKPIFFGDTVFTHVLKRRLLSFTDLLELFKKPRTAKIDQIAFHKLDSAGQLKYKNGPYFCPCSFDTPTRDNGSTNTIQLLCIDVDDPKHTPYVTAEALDITLDDFNWALYPTISSTHKKPRWRLIVETDGKISPAHYTSCLATIASYLGLTEISLESFTVSQPMFMPTRCRDASYELSYNAHGRAFTYEDINFDAAVHKLYASRKVRTTAGDKEAFEYLVPPLDIPNDDRIKDAMEFLDPDSHQQEWIKIGAALKHQYQHDPDEGFKIWNQWSEKGDKYGTVSSTKKFWNYLSANPTDREPVTIRSIFKMAKKEGWEDTISSEDTESYDDIVIAIQNAKDMGDLLESIPQRIARRPLSKTLRELLTTTLKDRIKEVTGKTYSIAVLRKACQYNPTTDVFENDEGVWLTDRKSPEWTEGFVYIRQTNEFFNTLSYERIIPEVVNNAYSRFMLTRADRMEGRTRPEERPQDFLLNTVSVPQYKGYVYMPQVDEPVVHFEGADCLNIFQDRKPARTKEGYQEVKDTLISHTEWLTSSKREARIIMDYLAYNVQNPGQKINWAILLQGVQGSGKTFFAEVIGAVLGREHIGTPDMSILNQVWTDWAEAKCMIFIEEVRIASKNRFVIMDKLKPFITNPVVTIARRNVNAYQIPNVSNYMLFSNHKDAIAIDDTDRRYCIIISEIQTPEQIERRGGVKYFEKLFGILDKPGTLRAVLEDWEIHNSFVPKGRAPLTRSRASLVEINKNDGQLSVEDILEDCKSPYIQRDLLSGKVLLDTATCEVGANLRMSRRDLSRLLTRMGYNNLGRTKIKGELHTIWLHPEHADARTKRGPNKEIRRRIREHKPEEHDVL